MTWSRYFGGIGTSLRTFDPNKYDTKCESLRQYRDIVNKNINISFHRPKNIRSKNQARTLKEVDKRESQNNGKIFCATYDLEKVLLAPSGGISLFLLL